LARAVKVISGRQMAEVGTHDRPAADQPTQFPAEQHAQHSCVSRRFSRAGNWPFTIRDHSGHGCSDAGGAVFRAVAERVASYRLVRTSFMT
jgi:hypothetical protein